MILSQTEENYLKAIFTLQKGKDSNISTNSIAELMETSPASVSDMLRKLAEKELIHYAKYKGVELSLIGKSLAIKLVRKHRLWEFFLVSKLGFPWDEVHEIAEQLEHIQSDKLISNLDKYLGFPKYDPHGDPIPDANGNFSHRDDFPMTKLEKNIHAQIVGVYDHTTVFLKYLDSKNLRIGQRLLIFDVQEYDKSISLLLDDQEKISISSQVAENLIVCKV